MDLREVLRTAEERIRTQVDTLTAALTRVVALERRAGQVLTRIQSDEQAFTALADRVTAVETELDKLDPGWRPPPGP